MKKKLVGKVLAVTLACTMFTGCGQSAQTASDGESVRADITADTETAVDGTDTAEDDGTVTLTVWAEEANFAVLQSMIESFEEQYAGQADFDIQLVESADADTKIHCLATYITVRTYSRCRMTSCPAWWQPVRLSRFRMRMRSKRRIWMMQ